MEYRIRTADVNTLCMAHLLMLKVMWSCECQRNDPKTRDISQVWYKALSAEMSRRTGPDRLVKSHSMKS